MGWLTRMLGLESAGPGAVVSVTDENFKDEVSRSQVPVLLDLWSDGCGPCKMLEPVVIELSKRYQGRLKVAEMNVAAGPKTAARLGVSGTPTVLYFENGHVVERIVGYRPLHYHRDFIDQELLAPVTAAPAP